MKSEEAKSYLTPYDPSDRPVYWFHDSFPANTWSRPHVHAWGELAYAGDGCMVMCTESGNWLASPHRAVWIPAGSRHEWYVPCAARDYSLWVDSRILLGVERFTRCHVMEVTPLVRELLLYLVPQPWSHGENARGRLVVVLLDLLLELPEVHPPVAMPRDHRLIELCTSLLTAPGDVVSLAQWAVRLGMSERNLGRLFKRETGVSFRTWRQYQRMQAARELLHQGENVTSVAMNSGYSSVSAFIATFKHFFGVTPGAFSRGKS